MNGVPYHSYTGCLIIVCLDLQVRQGTQPGQKVVLKGKGDDYIKVTDFSVSIFSCINPSMCLYDLLLLTPCSKAECNLIWGL